MLATTLAQQMIDIGRACHQRDWVPASGGNFSARLEANSILVTRSGVHKGQLCVDDFLTVDLQGQAQNSAHKPSAETLLHCERYRASAQIGAVLHTHSRAASLMPADFAELTLQGYELQKIFAGVDSHQSTLSIPVFANNQNIVELAERVAEKQPAHAYIIAGHGIYVWGDNLKQCYNRLEALEFLLDCEWQKQRWG